MIKSDKIEDTKNTDIMPTKTLSTMTLIHGWVYNIILAELNSHHKTLMYTHTYVYNVLIRDSKSTKNCTLSGER